MENCAYCGGEGHAGNFSCPVCNSLNYIQDVLVAEDASMHSRKVAKALIARLECGGRIIDGRIEGHQTEPVGDD